MLVRPSWGRPLPSPPMVECSVLSKSYELGSPVFGAIEARCVSSDAQDRSPVPGCSASITPDRVP